MNNYTPISLLDSGVEASVYLVKSEEGKKYIVKIHRTRDEKTSALVTSRLNSVRSIHFPLTYETTEVTLSSVFIIQKGETDRDRLLKDPGTFWYRTKKSIRRVDPSREGSQPGPFYDLFGFVDCKVFLEKTRYHPAPVLVTVMEWIDGVSVRSLLPRNWNSQLIPTISKDGIVMSVGLGVVTPTRPKPLRAKFFDPDPALVSVIAQTVVALQIFQESFQGFHGDLHEGNVLVRRTSRETIQEGGWVVKTYGQVAVVIDFGRACLYDNSSDAPRKYASVEIQEGKAVGTKKETNHLVADFYSSFPASSMFKIGLPDVGIFNRSSDVIFFLGGVWVCTGYKFIYDWIKGKCIWTDFHRPVTTGTEGTPRDFLVYMSELFPEVVRKE